MTDVILLVEDNPDDQELTRRALRQSRLLNRLVIVSDGVEALHYLFRTGDYAALGRAPRPRLVLLDLKLPKLGGLEVLRAIRGDARTRLLPVVMLTSSVEERDVVESYGCGANSYVRKPITFVEFVDAIGKLGLYWLLLNEAPPPEGA
jgi:two-component system response regulator